MSLNVTLFFCSKHILSNMHKSDFQDEDGELFTCVEQYYMYHKAVFHGRLYEAETIKSLHDPKQ